MVVHINFFLILSFSKFFLLLFLQVSVSLSNIFLLRVFSIFPRLVIRQHLNILKLDHLIMALPRIIIRVGLSMLTKQVLENPRLLYEGDIDFCIMSIENTLRIRSYEATLKCSGKGSTTVIETYSQDGAGPEIPLIRGHKMRCQGQRWQRGEREVYVCNCGFNTPVVTTNIPNTYQGDYDLYGTPIHFDSEEFICPKLEDGNFVSISPVEILKMYSRGEL